MSITLKQTICDFIVTQDDRSILLKGLQVNSFNEMISFHILGLLTAAAFEAPIDIPLNNKWVDGEVSELYLSYRVDAGCKLHLVTDNNKNSFDIKSYSLFKAIGLPPDFWYYSLNINLLPSTKNLYYTYDSDFESILITDKETFIVVSDLFNNSQIKYIWFKDDSTNLHDYGMSDASEQHKLLNRLPKETVKLLFEDVVYTKLKDDRKS